MKDETWAAAWSLIEERFGRECSAKMREFYRSRIEARLSEDQFRRAAERILSEYPWKDGQPYGFPRPADFVEAALDGGEDGRTVEDRAMEQWELCQRMMSDRRRASEIVEQMDPEGRRVVRVLGGPERLCMTKLEDVKWVRQKFLKRYGEARDAAERRERLPEMTDAGRELIDDALAGRLEPGEGAG